MSISVLEIDILGEIYLICCQQSVVIQAQHSVSFYRFVRVKSTTDCLKSNIVMIIIISRIEEGVLRVLAGKLQLIAKVVAICIFYSHIKEKHRLSHLDFRHFF